MTENTTVNMRNTLLKREDYPLKQRVTNPIKLKKNIYIYTKDVHNLELSLKTDKKIFPCFQSKRKKLIFQKLAL